MQHFVSKNIGSETLWPFSIPPQIFSDNDIPIAEFGSSNLGLFKNLYRKGLSNRYGRKMQSISGIHYNYSLPEELWPIISSDKNNLNSIRSDAYFGMLRNLYRMNWIILYFFGCSPIISKELIDGDKGDFLKLDSNSFYLPYATSLRMSDFGYQNSKRSLDVSLNSIDEYIANLMEATATVDQKFLELEKNGLEVQISPNILQIEDEFYAIARAKSQDLSNDRSLKKLKKSGVEFIELRSIDINPFSVLGIDKDSVYFIEMFLIYCFFKPSAPLSKASLETLKSNDLLVSKFGRDKKLKIKREENPINLKDWGIEILDEMTEIAESMDNNDKKYSNAIRRFKGELEDPNKTLSSKLLDRIFTEKISYFDLGFTLAEQNKSHYENRRVSDNSLWKLLQDESVSSIHRQKSIEKNDSGSFEDFKENYFR